MSQPEDPERPVYSPPAGRPVRTSWLVAVGACSLLLIIVSFFYTAQWYDARSDNRFLVAVTEAIAVAHAIPVPLEIESSDLVVVLGDLGTVDQRPVRDVLASRAGRLLGGRSVLLEGYPGIQLLYRAVDGRAVTRYAVVFPARQLAGLQGPGAGEPADRMLVQGVSIVIWRERGLAFAEAF